jgi:hypothetical protein
MACAELLRHLLCTEEGRGKSAIVVSRTHTHTRDRMVRIFQAILDNKVKGQQKGIALNEYKLLRSAPMQILLPFGGKITFWSLESGYAIKGLNVTYALIDEITDMDQKDFDDCFDRIGREGIPGGMWLAGNPTNVQLAVLALVERLRAARQHPRFANLLRRTDVQRQPVRCTQA